MPIKKSIRRPWHKLESGLVTPAGTVSDLSQSSSQTYLRIKEKALALEQLYAESKVLLPPTCDLACLIADAKALSDAWLLNRIDQIPSDLLFRVGHLNRIAEVVLRLERVPDHTKFLTALNSGSLNFLDRQKSNSKDVLWELELWSTLKDRSFDAVLAEPPDIVVAFEDSRIGIACKKLYSEKHVQNVLSEAVSQIESSFDFGIVAINLDDLLPPNRLLRTPTQKTLSQMIADIDRDFLLMHERHFRKYLASGRLLSVLVSTGVLADVYRERVRFHYARQAVVWTIPGLPREKDMQLRRFYGQFMG